MSFRLDHNFTRKTLGQRPRYLGKASAAFVLNLLGLFSFQLDTEYRKKWDALVIKLEVIERDVISGSEVLHWVTHFPVSIFTSGFTFTTYM